MSNDTLNNSIDYIKPLGVAIFGVAISDVNVMLSSIALCLSIVYSIYKLYKESKIKK